MQTAKPGRLLGEVYKGRLIWQDSFRWLVRGAYGPEGFKTRRAAKEFIDRLEEDQLKEEYHYLAND